MNSHGGQVYVLDPSDGLWRRVGSGLQVLFVGVFRHPLEVKQVQGVLVQRDEMRAFVVQDTLRDAAKHAVGI